MRGATRRALFGLAGALAAGGVLSGRAHAAGAEDFPSKPIRMLLPFPSGSGIDNSARIIGQYLTAQTGQRIVIDNRPGANGFIAATAAAAAAPDSCTMFVTIHTTHAANASLFPKRPYDPVHDFAPVGLIARSGLVLVVPVGSPVRNAAAAHCAARFAVR